MSVLCKLCKEARWGDIFAHDLKSEPESSAAPTYSFVFLILKPTKCWVPLGCVCRARSNAPSCHFQELNSFLNLTLHAVQLDNNSVFCNQERTTFPQHCSLLLSPSGLLLAVSLAPGFSFWPLRQKLALLRRAAVRSQNCFLGAGKPQEGRSVLLQFHIPLWQPHQTVSFFSFLIHKKALTSSWFQKAFGTWEWFLFVVLCWFWLGCSLWLCGSSNQVSICFVGKCLRHNRNFLCMWIETFYFLLILKPLQRFFQTLMFQMCTLCLCVDSCYLFELQQKILVHVYHHLIVTSSFLLFLF